MPDVVWRAVVGDALRVDGVRPLHVSGPAARRVDRVETRLEQLRAVVVDGLEQAAVVNDDATVLRLIVEFDAATRIVLHAGQQLQI